ncbi:TetR/AcrR family transcriptional regulator [Gorillibacterium massiliense]|uniref:TetR/AcrR family transcriptional regulator n=1 Tax=Gorillibacterium massiliense TaxID=1280390 RepID=UPI0004B325D7|nr:TetR/AcrR family transcriptional regulator [Gorillibacterium massiliense]
MTSSEDKTRTPQQERSIRTKEAILQAAMRLFSDKGYHNTTSKEIARAAGVSTGSFYSYFVDKKAVFIEALVLYQREFYEQVESYLANADLHNGNKTDFLVKLVESLIAAHQVYKEFHNELGVLYYAEPEVKKLMDGVHEQAFQTTLYYLKRWKDELKVDDLEAASVVVFNTMDIMVDKMVFEEGNISADRLKKELVQMLAVYLFREE